AAVAMVDASYITFNGVEFESTSTFCFYPVGKTHHITFMNNNFITCGNGSSTTAGIDFSTTATDDYDSITIQSNSFLNLNRRAVAFTNIDVANTNNFDNIRILNNTIINVGSGRDVNVGAIYIGILGGSTATFTNLNISNNNITMTGDE